MFCKSQKRALLHTCFCDVTLEDAVFVNAVFDLQYMVRRLLNEKELVFDLKELATDSSKHRAKKDKKQQRSSFRDIVRTVEVR